MCLPDLNYSVSGSLSQRATGWLSVPTVSHIISIKYLAWPRAPSKDLLGGDQAGYGLFLRSWAPTLSLQSGGLEHSKPIKSTFCCTSYLFYNEDFIYLVSVLGSWDTTSELLEFPK